MKLIFALSALPSLTSRTLSKNYDVPLGPIALCRKECNPSGEVSTDEKFSMF